ncbi:MAG: family 20 glycosylhydrolase [Buchananella hordeovulneris]|nr:family 20 glycosylhydrolase [Buchananella hordeovulneris]
MTSAFVGGTAAAADAAKNLALAANGGTVTASGTEVANNWTAAMGADGDVTTRWSSNMADNAWIQAQLANPSQVHHVNIYWERACAPTFRIDVSNDGAQWTDATGTLNAVCPDGATANETPQKIVLKDEYKNQTWKFVRMQGLDRKPFNGQKWGMSLFEFEVWNGEEPAPVVPGQDKPALIPVPVNVEWGTGTDFALKPGIKIIATGEGASSVGEILADEIETATGIKMPVVASAEGTGHITLKVASDVNTGTLTGDEAYKLTVGEAGATIEARNRAGVWNGTRTFKQLFPAAIYSTELVVANWKAPAVVITDGPRFDYRGSMLDPARSFITVPEVKKAIDSMADVKLNQLHLHLADDQGWRIQITNDGRVEGDTIDYTKLTEISGRTAMAGHRFDTQAGINWKDEIGRTGFYTQEQYREIVAYAAARNINVVPEIDLPGHTQSALHAIPELNTPGSSFDGGGTTTAPQHSTGDVGKSYLDPNSQAAKNFISHVFKQLADMTPGPIMHMGGDEPHAMAVRYGHSVYAASVADIVNRVKATGKKAMGWNEIAESQGVGAGDIVQYWTGGTTHTLAAVGRGAKVVISKDNAAYLDMKYNRGSVIGLTWAGYGDFDNYYAWNPGTVINGLSEENIMGVEGPMWGETLRGGRDVQFMLMPRATSHAEVGWSPQAKRSATDFKLRMGAHAQRLVYADQNFYDGERATWQHSVAGAPGYAKPGEATRVIVGHLAAPGTVTDGNGVRQAVAADASGASKSTVEGTLTYTINFGDNTPEVQATITTDMARTRTTAAGLYKIGANHTYANAGQYQITVTGSDGSSFRTLAYVAADAPVPTPKTSITQCGTVTMQLSKTTLKPDEWPTLTATGFTSESFVTVKLGDYVIGTLKTDEAGKLERNFPIPFETYGGTYPLTIEQTDSTGAKCTANTNVRIDSDRVPLANPIDLTNLPASAVTASSEETGENGQAVKAIDGNPATFWHSRWRSNVPVHPHWIAFDLGKSYDLTGFSLRARGDNVNGRIKDFKFQTSTNGTDWADHVSTEMPNNVRDNIFQCVEGAQNCTTFPKVTTRYVRLYITSSWPNDKWATLAELRLGGTETTVAPSPEPTVQPTVQPSVEPKPTVTRHSGNDRVGTALAMFKAGNFAGTDAVLASDAGFADGLAATPLADALDAPVLLTRPAGIAPEVLNELKAKGITRVFVVGGPKSVGPKVVASLKGAGIEVVRLDGASRYETAAKVAGKLSELKGGLNKLFLVDGNAFPDALAVGAIAQRHNGALLLTDGAKLPVATVKYLEKSSADVVAVGGNAVAAAKGSTVVGTVFTQVRGADRYQTAAKVAKDFGGDNVKVIGVASGLVYADALAAGAYTAQNNGVLLLTEAGKLSAPTADYLKSAKGASVVIAGGPKSVSEGVKAALAALLK